MITEVCAPYRSSVEIQDVDRLASRPAKGVGSGIPVPCRVRVVHRRPLVHRQRSADRPLAIVHHSTQGQCAIIHNRTARVVNGSTRQSQVSGTIFG